MPTVIDSLIVSLGLDPAGYRKGEREADASMTRLRGHAEKTTKELERHGKQASESYSSVRNEIVKIGAAILSVHTISEFVSRITEADVTTGRLAANLEMGTKELSSWERLIKNFGGTAQQMDADFKSLNNQLAEFQTTGKVPTGMLNALALLGVDVKKFLDPLVSWTEKMFMLSDKFEKLPARLRMTAGNQLGISEATVNMISTANGKLREMFEHQRNINSVSERDKELALEREHLWNAFVNRVEAAGRTIMNDFQPHLEKGYTTIAAMVEKFGEFVKWGETNHVADWAENMVNAARRSAGLPALGELPPMTQRAVPGKDGKWVQPNGAVGGTIRTVPGAVGRALGKGPGDDVQSYIEKYTNEHEKNLADIYATLKNTKDKKARDILNEQITIETKALTDDAERDRVIRERMATDAALNAVRASRLNDAAGPSVQKTDVNIQTLNVNAPNARDAQGVAREIGPELKKSMTVNQATSGMAP